MALFGSSGKRISLAIPRSVRSPFLVSFLMTAVTTLVVLTVYFTIQPVVPLFYSRANPADQLVNKEWLVFFPLLSLSISFFHLVIVNLIGSYGSLFIKLFSWATAFVQVLLTLSLIRIVIIVI